MAKLVGVFAASHGPMIAREWDSLSPPTRSLVEQGFGQVGHRLMMSRPDVLIIVSPDHWCNFFLNNFPAFCVGIGGSTSLTTIGTIGGIGSRPMRQSGRQKP